MQYHYLSQDRRSTRAMVSLSRDPWEDSASTCVWVINRVSVPMARDRGQGIARGIMAQVCADADQEQVTLRLAIVPDGGPGSLDYRQLQAWYRRLGFLPDVNFQHWWNRPPRPVAA
jgi:hypothetical protein